MFTRMKAFVAAVVLTLLAASVQTKTLVSGYTFNNGEYIAFTSEYTDSPCEEYWYGTTVDWDGGAGFCEYSEADVLAAKAGDKRFSPDAVAVILRSQRLASGKFGSPVAILD